MLRLKTLIVVFFAVSFIVFPFAGQAGVLDKAKDKAKKATARVVDGVATASNKTEHAATAAVRKLPPPGKVANKIDAAADKIDEKSSAAAKKAHQVADEIRK